MKIHRRQAIKAAAATVMLPAIAPIASAQTFPTRPVTLIVKVIETLNRLTGIEGARR